MSNFVNLNKTLLSMQIDPATAKQPIKRMFVADGDFLSANVSILTDTENALHTQPNHDEIVLVLEGEVEFRVGEEVRRVGPGDLMLPKHRSRRNGTLRNPTKLNRNSNMTGTCPHRRVRGSSFHII